MSTRRQLSFETRYNSEAAYFRASDRRAIQQQANPIITATASGRDPVTGQLIATTLGGGEERLRSLTNASLEQGAVLPSVVRGANQGSVDKKPF